jgi:hypothetical protein
MPLPRQGSLSSGLPCSFSLRHPCPAEMLMNSDSTEEWGQGKDFIMPVIRICDFPPIQGDHRFFPSVVDLNRWEPSGNSQTMMTRGMHSFVPILLPMWLTVFPGRLNEARSVSGFLSLRLLRACCTTGKTNDPVLTLRSLSRTGRAEAFGRSPVFRRVQEF